MLPDLDGRKKILSVHSLSKPLSNEVDLGYWASRTVGFSGADLANLMNESAIHCARDESKLISDLHIENALDKITIGLRSSLITSPNMKKIIAYNEVGRAIVSAVRNGIESVDKITILPRSGSIGGYTKICPDEDVISSGLISKKLLFSKIEIALAGRAAETIVFGEGEITQCSMNDISYATNIVREMVTKYGFSIIGPISMDSDNNEMYLGDGLFRRKPLIAENTSSRIDNEIINISKISLNNSIKILKKNRALLDKLVDILLNQETIDKKVFKLTTSKLLKVWFNCFKLIKNIFLIIKSNTSKLIVTLSFLLILPFVQKQWFNLYSLNINDISFYSILYYLSGAICPSLVCLNSLKNYTYYKFNKDKFDSI